MRRRWAVVARDVNGTQIDVVSRHWFLVRANNRAEDERRRVWQPIARQPLYYVKAERI